MKLNQFLTEAVTKSGDMEDYIVKVWNKEELSDIDPKDIESAQKSVNFLKKQKLSGKAIHMGESLLPVTEIFNKYSGVSSSRSKTDLIIGKSKISLKEATGFQITSGALKTELRGTLFSIIETKYNHLLINIMNDLDKEISQLSNIKAPGQIGVVKKDINVPVEVQKIMELNDSFGKKIMSLFNNNKELYIDLVSELSSGRLKFGNNSLAACDYAYIFGKYDVYKSIDDKNFLKKLASKARIDITFKSNSEKKRINKQTVKTGRYNAYAVIRMNITSGNLKKMLENAYTIPYVAFNNEPEVAVGGGEYKPPKGIIPIMLPKEDTQDIKDAWAEVRAWMGTNVDRVFDYFCIDVDMSCDENIVW